MDRKYFDRLIGLPTEHKDKQKLWETYAEDVIVNQGGRKIEEFEIEKTPRDLEIITLAEQSAREFLKKHGRDNEINVSLSNIHFLKPGGTESYTEGRLIEGGHASTRQSVLIDRVESDAQVALITFHELVHLLSYKALQVTKNEKPSIEDYRSGFSVKSRDGKETYFGDFEEAVIALATDDFLETVVKTNPIFKQEIDEREKNGNILVVSRGEELEKLNTLIDDLFVKNNNQFSSRDEIMSMFIDAQVNGDLLKVGRLIEKTYGSGSFREIGQGNYKKIK